MAINQSCLPSWDLCVEGNLFNIRRHKQKPRLALVCVWPSVCRRDWSSVVRGFGLWRYGGRPPGSRGRASWGSGEPEARPIHTMCNIFHAHRILSKKTHSIMLQLTSLIIRPQLWADGFALNLNFYDAMEDWLCSWSRGEQKKCPSALTFRLPAANIFQPLAFETHGATHSSALVNAVGGRSAADLGDPRETSFLWQRISVLIQRFNAILISETFFCSDEAPDL